jgi:uncharacterized membrane protein
MDKGRLEAFTDGVIAIIITIMVLETKAPDGADLNAILAAAPAFAVYALSYVNVGILWANHHHIFHATERVDGRVLWINLLLLFWTSLLPLILRWMNDAHFAAAPTAAYGFDQVLLTISYILLERAIIACNGPNSKLAAAIGGETKGALTLIAFAAAALLAFFNVWIAVALYIATTLSWFIPDRRIERTL